MDFQYKIAIACFVWAVILFLTGTDAKTEHSQKMWMRAALVVAIVGTIAAIF